MQRHILNCSNGCPVKNTLQIISGKRKNVILYHFIKNKVCRFSESQKKMPNCSRRVLSLQLNELGKDKVIEEEIYPVIPPKAKYRMTKFGKTLAPVILEMDEWG